MYNQNIIDASLDKRNFLFQNKKSLVFNNFKSIKTEFIYLQCLCKDLLSVCYLDNFNKFVNKSVNLTYNFDFNDYKHIFIDMILKQSFIEKEICENATTYINKYDNSECIIFKDLRIQLNLPDNFSLYKDNKYLNTNSEPIYFEEIEKLLKPKFNSDDLLNSENFNKTIFDKLKLESYDVKTVFNTLKCNGILTKEKDIKIYEKVLPYINELKPHLNFYYWCLWCKFVPLNANRSESIILNCNNVETCQTPIYLDTLDHYYHSNAKYLFNRADKEIQKVLNYLKDNLESNVGEKGVYKIIF